MKKQLMITCVFISAFTCMMAQTKPADTVVIRVGDGSKVIFAIQDKKDLETLKYYNFQALMDDMITKLENDDTTSLKKPSEEYLKDTVTTLKAVVTTTGDNGDDDEEDDERTVSSRNRRTKHSFNVELGFNNYLEGGKFPDQNNSQYTLSPWGSGSLALNSILRTPMGKNAFLEWGGGISWHNFKFQDDRTHMIKGSNGVEFTQDARDFDFQKSKLSVTYLNVSAVPMFAFGGHSSTTAFHHKSYKRSFRMGVGPYAGYRIDTFSKLVYKEDGDKRKEKGHENYYLNNFRYGVRFQMGFRDTDLFFSYDLNSLYSKNKGPELHVFNFGITI
jgi:hypothetical protein